MTTSMLIAEIALKVIGIGCYTYAVFICGRAWEYASPSKRGEQRD